MLTMAATAHAEEAPDPSQLRAVDPAISDIDPLLHSLRKVQTGLRYGGEQTNIFQPVNRGVVDSPTARSIAASPVNTVYYRMGPGYLARVPRMDYLVLRQDNTIGVNEPPGVDNKYRAFMTNDVVYLINQVPIRSQIPTQYDPWMTAETDDNPLRVDATRVDMSIDRRIDRRVDNARVEPRVGYNP